ncbi:hypothetical protein [Novosphingobium sp.]|jgi:hypothetical protein|uniref:hypothetical protein n=1 Tax=Novosphingobium sp. TaxID=1874826 RepID=UPI002FE3C9BD
MLGDGTDVLIGYCSSRSTTPDTSVDKVELLRALANHADCGTTLVKTANAFQREASAGALAMFLLSPEKLALLADYTFSAK